MTSVGLLQAMADAETARGMIPRQETLQALTTAASEMRQLADLGYNQQVSAIEEALRGGKITEDKRQQLLDSAYDEFLRLQDLSQSVTTGLYSTMIPASIGSRQRQTQLGFGLSK